MVQLGAMAAAEVLEEWQSVIPTSTRIEATGASFFEAALGLVRLRRHQVQAIVIPFMRLYRALATGSTFQPIFDAEPETIQLSKLRADFVDAVTRYAPEALESGVVHDHHPNDGLDQETVVSNPDDSPFEPYDIERYRDELDDILTEEIERLEEILDAEERRAEAEAEAVINNLGPELLKERLAKLEDEETTSARVVDDLQEEEHGKVGIAVSAHAERMVQNGGRFALTEVGKADPRVIGFVRVHFPEKDPQPCGFCALLISKGLKYAPYTSEYAARLEGSQFDEFHPRCHCEAIPVYSQEEYDNDSRFDINRELWQLYKDEFQDMTQWRRLMRSRAAQAAAGQE